MPEFFYAENFAKPPKDNFAILFTRMFGYMGFFALYLMWQAPELVVFKASVGLWYGPLAWAFGGGLWCQVAVCVCVSVAPQARR